MTDLYDLINLPPIGRFDHHIYVTQKGSATSSSNETQKYKSTWVEVEFGEDRTSLSKTQQRTYTKGDNARYKHVSAKLSKPVAKAKCSYC